MSQIQKNYHQKKIDDLEKQLRYYKRSVNSLVSIVSTIEDDCGYINAIKKELGKALYYDLNEKTRDYLECVKGLSDSDKAYLSTIGTFESKSSDYRLWEILCELSRKFLDRLPKKGGGWMYYHWKDFTHQELRDFISRRISKCTATKLEYEALRKLKGEFKNECKNKKEAMCKLMCINDESYYPIIGATRDMYFPSLTDSLTVVCSQVDIKCSAFLFNWHINNN